MTCAFLGCIPSVSRLVACCLSSRRLLRCRAADRRSIRASRRLQALRCCRRLWLASRGLRSLLRRRPPRLRRPHARRRHRRHCSAHTIAGRMLSLSPRPHSRRKSDRAARLTALVRRLFAASHTANSVRINAASCGNNLKIGGCVRACDTWPPSKHSSLDGGNRRTFR